MVAIVTEEQLALRRAIFEAFAATGAPPEVPDSPDLRALQAAHVVALDDDRRIVMAHPFAAHENGARVDADGRTWWGNCAWDGFGIVHALALRDATITAQGHTTSGPGIEFEVAVPAARWWDDIGHT
jgi:Alkylmercury lyase